MTGIPWKLIGAFALAAIMGICLFQAKRWHDAYVMLPSVIEESEKAAAAAQAKYDSLNSAYKVKLAASQRYQDELEVLRQQRADAPPAPVIRVCKAAPVPRKDPAPTRLGEAATAPVVLPEPIEFDTGPLYGLADRCDELSAQARQLIDLAK